MKKKEKQKKQRADKTCLPQAGVRDTRWRDASDTNARNGKTQIGNRRKNFNEPSLGFAPFGSEPKGRRRDGEPVEPRPEGSGRSDVNMAGVSASFRAWLFNNSAVAVSSVVAFAVPYDLLPTTYYLSSKSCNNASIPAKTVHFGSPRFSSVQFGTAPYSLVQAGTGAKKSQVLCAARRYDLDGQECNKGGWCLGRSHRDILDEPGKRAIMHKYIGIKSSIYMYQIIGAFTHRPSPCGRSLTKSTFAHSMSSLMEIGSYKLSPLSIGDFSSAWYTVAGIWNNVNG